MNRADNNVAAVSLVEKTPSNSFEFRTISTQLPPQLPLSLHSLKIGKTPQTHVEPFQQPTGEETEASSIFAAMTHEEKMNAKLQIEALTSEKTLTLLRNKKEPLALAAAPHTPSTPKTTQHIQDLPSLNFMFRSDGTLLAETAPSHEVTVDLRSPEDAQLSLLRIMRELLDPRATATAQNMCLKTLKNIILKNPKKRSILQDITSAFSSSKDVRQFLSLGGIVSLEHRMLSCVKTVKIQLNLSFLGFLAAMVSTHVPAEEFCVLVTEPIVSALLRWFSLVTSLKFCGHVKKNRVAADVLSVVAYYVKSMKALGGNVHVHFTIASCDAFCGLVQTTGETELLNQFAAVVSDLVSEFAVPRECVVRTAQRLLRFATVRPQVSEVTCVIFGIVKDSVSACGMEAFDSTVSQEVTAMYCDFCENFTFQSATHRRAMRALLDLMQELAVSIHSAEVLGCLYSLVENWDETVSPQALKLLSLQTACATRKNKIEELYLQRQKKEINVNVEDSFLVYFHSHGTRLKKYPKHVASVVKTLISESMLSVTSSAPAGVAEFVLHALLFLKNCDDTSPQTLFSLAEQALSYHLTHRSRFGLCAVVTLIENILCDNDYASKLCDSVGEFGGSAFQHLWDTKILYIHYAALCYDVRAEELADKKLPFQSFKSCSASETRRSLLGGYSNLPASLHTPTSIAALLQRGVLYAAAGILSYPWLLESAVYVFRCKKEIYCDEEVCSLLNLIIQGTMGAGRASGQQNISSSIGIAKGLDALASQFIEEFEKDFGNELLVGMFWAVLKLRCDVVFEHALKLPVQVLTRAKLPVCSVGFTGEGIVWNVDTLEAAVAHLQVLEARGLAHSCDWGKFVLYYLNRCSRTAVEGKSTAQLQKDWEAIERRCGASLARLIELQRCFPDSSEAH